MKLIVLETHKTIELSSVNSGSAIIATKNGQALGMICHEKEGWILRYPDGDGATGHHSTIRKCIESSPDYEFFT